MGARFKVLGFSNISNQNSPSTTSSSISSLVNLPGFSLQEEKVQKEQSSATEILKK